MIIKQNKKKHLIYMIIERSCYFIVATSHTLHNIMLNQMQKKKYLFYNLQIKLYLVKTRGYCRFI